MSKAKLTIVIVVAIVASVVACGLVLVSNSSPYSSPEKSLSAFVAAESRADLSAMERPAGAALFQNFIGHFGEVKYQEVRNVYQQAYDLAEPNWQQYREKARAAASRERERLAEEISTAGRTAFGALSADSRLQLTEDRPRFNEFIFEEGLKALPANERAKIGDPRAFREGRDFNEFVDRQGFALLSNEDQQTLKSPAALSSVLTPERVAFLEGIGLPQLSPQQRRIIESIPSSELRNPQAFMQRYGRDPAREFLKNSALDQKVTVKKCHYLREDNFGSLFKGPTASCDFVINVRGTSVELDAALLRQGGFWRIVGMSQMLPEIRAAYPPTQSTSNALPAESPTIQPEMPQETVMPTQYSEVSMQGPRLPRASWIDVSDPSAATAERDTVLAVLLRIFPSSTYRFLIALLFTFMAIVVFCITMTINFRRLRNQTFLPEWLEGEVPLEEIEVSHWWSRVWLRLTNKRIVQVRLSWLFSRRKIFGIALDDIHSVTWRRYTNWLLVLIGICLFGRTNPIALLLLIWGIDSKILAIGFNTPLAQMPFPRAHAGIISFRRGQFNDLAAFYKKAQLYLAQVRTQKQLPVSRDVSFIPEEDKDFSWGLVVWVFVGLWLLITLCQRTLGDHVTLEGFWGGLLLGLPVAAAIQSLRSGVWSGILGAAALVAVKFPGSIGLVLLASDSDGGFPNLWQYVVLVLAAGAIAAAAYALSSVNLMAALAAPLLWLLPIAIMQRALLAETRTYATCFTAIASAAVFSILAGVIASRGRKGAAEQASAVSEAVSA